MRQTRRSKFKQAFPHILGFYAVAALLTAATIYDRVPESRFSHDTRMEVSINAGILWPFTWTTLALFATRG